jgi:hypothetical protein
MVVPGVVAPTTTSWLRRSGDALDRRGVPHERDIGFAIGAADPDQLGRVELGARLQQRRRRDAVDRDPDHGAVLGALAIELVGHDRAAGSRLVLHDEVRTARNVVDDVAGDDARKQIVATAHRRADHHPQLLAPIERGDIVLRARRHGSAETKRDDKSAAYLHARSDRVTTR